MSGSQDELEGRGFIFNFFHYLWLSDPLNEQKKVKVHIPDTIYYKYGKSSIWYFSTSEGCVSRRNQDKLNAQKIKDIFFKKAPKCGIVAYFIHFLVDKNGQNYIEYEYFDKPQFEAFIEVEDYNREGYLQQFVQPRGQYNSQIKVIWGASELCFFQYYESKIPVNDKRYDMYQRGLLSETVKSNAEEKPLPATLQPNRIETLVNNIAEHIQNITNFRRKIVHLEVIMKFDHQDRLILQYCEAVKTNVVNSDKSLRGLTREIRLPNYVNENFLHFSTPKELTKSLNCMQCGEGMSKENSYQIPMNMVVKAWRFDHIQKSSTQSSNSVQSKIDLGSTRPVTQQQPYSGQQMMQISKDYTIPKNIKNIFPKITEKDFSDKNNEALFAQYKIPVCLECYFQILDSSEISENIQQQIKFYQNQPLQHLNFSQKNHRISYKTVKSHQSTKVQGKWNSSVDHSNQKRCPRLQNFYNVTHHPDFVSQSMSNIHSKPQTPMTQTTTFRVQKARTSQKFFKSPSFNYQMQKQESKLNQFQTPILSYKQKQNTEKSFSHLDTEEMNNANNSTKFKTDMNDTQVHSETLKFNANLSSQNLEINNSLKIDNKEKSQSQYVSLKNFEEQQKKGKKTSYKKKRSSLKNSNSEKIMTNIKSIKINYGTSQAAKYKNSDSLSAEANFYNELNQTFVQNFQMTSQQKQLDIENYMNLLKNHKFVQKINENDFKLCPVCQENGDVEHFLLNCSVQTLQSDILKQQFQEEFGITDQQYILNSIPYNNFKSLLKSKYPDLNNEANQQLYRLSVTKFIQNCSNLYQRFQDKIYPVYKYQEQQQKQQQQISSSEQLKSQSSSSIRSKQSKEQKNSQKQHKNVRTNKHQNINNNNSIQEQQIDESIENYEKSPEKKQEKTPEKIQEEEEQQEQSKQQTSNPVVVIEDQNTNNSKVKFQSESQKSSEKKQEQQQQQQLEQNQQVEKPQEKEKSEEKSSEKCQKEQTSEKLSDKQNDEKPVSQTNDV